MSVTDYGRHHPGGSIGRKIWTNVEDLMYPLDQTPIGSITDNLLEVMNLMIHYRTGICFFMRPESKQLIGLVSNADLRQHLVDGGQVTDLIEDLINQEPITVTKNQSIDLLFEQISSEEMNYITGIPVITVKRQLLGYLDYKKLLKWK